MKKLLEISLGIVTSIGGFLEIGSIATAAQAGAEFGYQLLWALALGGICVAFLVEQGGRHLNEEVEFTVTNAMQTSAGRMIFGRLGDGATPPPRRTRPRTEPLAPAAGS